MLAVFVIFVHFIFVYFCDADDTVCTCMVITCNLSDYLFYSYYYVSLIYMYFYVQEVECATLLCL